MGWAVWLVAAGFVLQGGPDLEVDPYAVESPDGRRRLEVEPRDRRGFGASDVRLWRDGELETVVTLPFTWKAAAITDDGYCVGHGRTGFGSGGDLVVGIVAPDGSILREERHRRTMASAPHIPPNPHVEGWIVDPAGEWWILRVRDADLRRGWEQWWRYPITAEGPREEFIPEHALRDLDHPWLRGVQALPGTAWILTHWSVSGGGTVRGTFALMDSRARVIWRLDGPPEAGGHGSKRLGILEVNPDGRFAIGHAGGGERVVYRADPDAPEAERVVEVGRGRFDPEARFPKPPAVPVRRLASATVIALPIAPAATPLRDLCDFGFDAEGRPIAVRKDGPGRYASVLLDLDGEVLREVHWDALPERLASGNVRIHALHRGRWLVSAVPWNDSGAGEWFVVDAAAGALRPVEGLASGSLPDAHAADGAPDGGFVVAMGGILRFSADGVFAGVIEDGGADDVAVQEDGSLAVLETAAEEVRIYAADGTLRRTIGLGEPFGQDPAYPSQIHADGDGWLIQDGQGDPPLWRLAADGSVRARITPWLATGHAPEVLYRHARPGPGGALWAMDDLSLHVLDADGRVVRTLGAPWDPARLDLPADAVIDGLGRVCVRDGRTGAIHVFDAEGRLLFVARMAPEDGDARHAFGRVALRPDGGILVEQAGCAVRFDAAGERIGQAPRAKCSIFLELPGTRFVHGSHFEPLTLLDASGAVIAVHDKAPDGRWFRDPRGASLSADGRAALLMQESIVLLDAEGRLQRAIALPERPWYGSRISMGRKRILVAGTRPEALVYSSVTANWERVVVGPHEPGARWSLGLTADGTEILALDQRTWELHRVPLAGD